MALPSDPVPIISSTFTTGVTVRAIYKRPLSTGEQYRDYDNVVGIGLYALSHYEAGDYYRDEIDAAMLNRALVSANAVPVADTDTTTAAALELRGDVPNHKAVRPPLTKRLWWILDRKIASDTVLSAYVPADEIKDIGPLKLS